MSNGNDNLREQMTIWLCLVFIIFMIGVFCSEVYSGEEQITSKQQFFSLISGHMERYEVLREELKLLNEVGNQNKIDDKKIQLYRIMERILNQKRQLFQNRIDWCERAYIRLKKDTSGPIDMSRLDSCHMRIRDLEAQIEKISRYIENFRERVRDIRREKRRRNRETVSLSEIKKYKKDIADSMRPLIAKEINLSAAGANPHEISLVKREIRHLKKEYRILCEKIEQDDDVIQSELRSIIDDVDSSLDTESLQRKNLTDKYKYRFDQRETRSAAEFKRINHQSSPVRRLNQVSEKRIDHRLQAPRSDHDKPSKTIEKY